MIIRGLLALVFVLTSVLQPMAQAFDSERYVFRYKAGIGSGATVQPEPEEPEVPVNPDDYDVTARLFGIVGEPFHSFVPTKQGGRSVEWEIVSGTLPEGLIFNEETGLISGTPAETAEDRRLAVQGYGTSAQMGTSASVTIDIVEPQDGAYRQEIYAHTDRPAYHRIESGGKTVDEWAAVIPLPEWAQFINGHISFTAPTAGTWPFAFQGKDFIGRDVAFTYGHILVEDGPTVAFVPDLIQHPEAEFRVAPATERSIGEVFWQLEGDSLPRNLIFDYATGAIEGFIPTRDIEATFRFKATDIDGTVGYSNDFTLGTISPGIPLDQVGNLFATAGRHVEFNFSTDSVIGERSWSLVSGDLPDGLSINAETGSISGIPSVPGEYPGIIVRVASATADQQSDAFSIIVQDAPLGIEQQQNVYHLTAWSPIETLPIAVSGGVEPYTLHLAEDVVLPDGLHLDEETGVISGTAADKGNLSVVLYATDATEKRRSNNFTVGIHAYGEPQVTVGAVYEGVRLSQFTPEIQPVLEPYSLIPEVTWSIDGPELPQGLEFNPESGRVIGIPTVHGEFGPYTLRATGADGVFAASSEVTIIIADVPDIIVTAQSQSLPRLVQLGHRIVSVENTVGNSTYNIVEGALPQGLTLQPNGVLSGSTQHFGLVEGLVVEVTDSEGRTGRSTPFSLDFVQPGAIEFEGTEFTWAAGVAFETPAAVIGNTVGALAFEGVSLPEWASVNPSTGGVSGTFATPSEDPINVHVRVTDETGRSAVSTIALLFRPAISLSLPSVLEFPRLSTANRKLSVQNRIGNLEWSVSGLASASGIGFDRSSGSFVGKAEQEGEWNVTVTVTDTKTGLSDTKSTTLRVTPRLELNVDYGNRTIYRGQDRGLPIRPRGDLNAAGDVAWTLQSTLPAGLSFNSQTGALEGIPAQAGIYSGITVHAVDEEGSEATDEFTITVTLEGPITPQHTNQFSRKIRADGLLRTSLPLAGQFGNVLQPLRFDAIPGPGLNDPDGLELVADTGAIVGIPDAESRTFSLRVRDALNRSKSLQLNLSTVGVFGMTYGDVTIAQHQAVPASFAPVVTNQIGSISYALEPQALPEGLFFSSTTGRITGTTEAIGDYGTYTITATDSADGAVVAQSFNLTVTERLPINLDYGVISLTAGAEFSPRRPKNPTNIVGEATWSIEGDLPQGIRFNAANGAFERSGSTVAGLYQDIVFVSVTDENEGAAGPIPVTFRITPRNPISLAQTVTRTVRLGQDFATAAVTPGNAPAPLVFTAHGDLQGFDLDPATGSVSGRIDSLGTVDLPLRVTDVLGRGLNFTLRISVVEELALTMDDIQAQRLRSVSAMPDTRNAVGSRLYDLVQGLLPEGLNLNHATGVVSGTVTNPSLVGEHGPFILEVEDSTMDVTPSNPFMVNVAERAAPGLSYSIPMLGAGSSQGLPISPSLTDIVPPLTWNFDGLLPTGLNLDEDGRIVGVPAEIGTWDNVEVTVTDAEGQSGYATLSFAVLPAGINPGQPLRAGNIVVTTRSGESFTTDAPTITNGAAPYVFATEDNLGSYSLDASTGVISGTAGAPGTQTFNLMATDVTGRDTQFTVTASIVGDLQASFESSSITALSLLPFSTTPSVENAIGTVTWELAAGSLPNGLEVDARTGAIHSGEFIEGSENGPRQVGTWPGIRLRATDAAGGTALTAPLTLTVQLNGLPISLETANLTAKRDFDFISSLPIVGNAIGDISFHSDNGGLFGVTVNSVTGEVSGNFAQQGEFVIDLTVTDSTRRVTSEPIVISVMPNLRLTVNPMASVLVNRALEPMEVATDYAIGAVAYEIVGDLPNGLSINASSGTISGTPDQLGTIEGLRVRGTDAYGDTQLSNEFSITVLDDGTTPTIVSIPAIPMLTTTVEMTAVTPTVQFKKFGDIYSLNQALPEGLILDEATGMISGTPALDAHGIYDGYVLTVSDVNERNSESNPFNIVVRHIDGPGLEARNQPYRLGVAFITGPMGVANPNVFIGSPVFSITSGGSGLSIDPATGAISGTLTANRTVRVQVADDSGSLAAVNVTFQAAVLQVSFTNQVLEAGSSINGGIVGTGIVTQNPVYSVEWEHGRAPQGITLDPETGQFSGAMPFGIYQFKAILTDGGDTVKTPANQASWYQIRGTDPNPASLEFVNLIDQNHEAWVTSNTVRLSGPSNVYSVYVSPNASFRMCYDPGCEYPEGNWSGSGQLANGWYLQLRMQVSEGSEQTATATITVSAGGETPVTGEWNVTSAWKDIPTFAQISAGYTHSCGLKTDGSAWCWGAGTYGRLGNGETSSSIVPVLVSGEQGFDMVSAGTDHSCGVKTDGSAWCWGYGGSGQLGNGSAASSNNVVPVQVSGDHTFDMVSAGPSHSCGVKIDGSAWCWGYGGNGQLGNDGTSNSNTPVQVSGGHVFTMVSTGNSHSCGVKADGSAWCWGTGVSGQLGNGKTGYNNTSNVPAQVLGDHAFEMVSMGFSHSCGVRTDGSAWCWGDGRNGRLGNGKNTNSNVPVQVLGGHVFTMVSTGNSHSCGVKTDGSAWCWGSNVSGQLGNGETADSNVPVLVIE